MIKKIDHFVITSKNISSTVDFYSRLGFQVKDCGTRYELYAGDFKINVHILDKELFPHALNVKSGSSDICFEIEGNIDVYKKDLIDRGFEIELGVVKRTGVKGEMNSVYIRDFDGNLLEFCSYE